MKPTQHELTQWAINQITKKYPNDIALLIAISGHALDDDCHGECFDYFIPANDNGYNLSQTFIIDGVGHDLYPRSWERIKNMAEFNDDFTFGLGEAIILYYRNEEDKNRFIEMQERQKANMADTSFMLKKALEKVDAAMEIYRTMMFEDKLYKVRMAAGFIAHFLSIAIACMNGTYFKQRLDLDTIELAQMKAVPENFIVYYEAIVKAQTNDELKTLSHMIISTTRKFMGSQLPQRDDEEKNHNYKDLAGWYEELSLSLRRIYYHCDTNNYKRAFPDALNVQNELNVIKEEFGLREMDLMGAFDIMDMKGFKLKAQELERYIVAEIEDHGIKINKYESLEQFLEKNS